jgi:transcriptional regulator with PAS, ATPase and Fis domain
MILCQGETITTNLFETTGNKNHSIQVINDENLDLDLNEKNLILKALNKANNNKAQAAKLLNITWQSLDRRLTKFNIRII